MGMEGSGKQTLHETAGMVDLDAVVEHQEQHAQGHAHGHVQVGSGKDAVIIENVAVMGAKTGYLEDPGQDIDRHEVEHVHQDDPEKYGERKRRYKKTRFCAGNNDLGLRFDNVDEHFDGKLEAARNFGGGQLGGAPEKEDNKQACKNGQEKGIVVDETEISDGRLLLAGVIQVNQVMLNVPGLWRYITSSHLNEPLSR